MSAYQKGNSWRLLAFALCIWGLISVSCAVRLGASSQKFEVQKHLKRLNKPAVKSIESPDGDIIDCVHVSNQPAFDHPYLKDHKIQMKPNSHPEGLFDENKASAEGTKEKSNPIKQLWHLNGKCPEDTIPVRRTKEEDILRASSVKRYGMKKQRTIPKPGSANPDLKDDAIHEHSFAYVGRDKYYGTKATINVWEPKVQRPEEFSLAQVWIVSGSLGEDLNTIEAGWQVFPNMYGDNHTRLFAYWTSDSYQTTGCYNLLCSGFVQVSSEITVGGSIISPVSGYRNSQYEIDLLIWKDPFIGHWWLQIGDQVVGYWPSVLFSYLADSATVVEWGGEVVNTQHDGRHTTTQMGSGHFPEEGFGKSTYFKNIQVVDESNHFKVPTTMGTTAEYPNCYGVKAGRDRTGGHYFYFGGPGRNQNCP